MIAIIVLGLIACACVWRYSVTVTTEPRRLVDDEEE